MSRSSPKNKLQKADPPTLAEREAKLVERIVNYFKLCSDKEELPQMAGLLIELGLNRNQWEELAKEFPVATSRADHFIEKVWVERLNSPSAAGAMFYLKNTFRTIYKDKSEHDVTLRVPKPILEGVQPIPLP